jgi:hypothetical protein
VLTNAAACLLFVVLRPPAPAEYLAEVDAARQAGGGMSTVNTVDGTLACRQLYSWSEWHGGERLPVKVLEVANAPALAVTAVFAAAGKLGVARLFSACSWSWLLGGVFMIAASIQWWLAGIVIEIAARRFRNRNSVRRG